MVSFSSSTPLITLPRESLSWGTGVHVPRRIDGQDLARDRHRTDFVTTLAHTMHFASQIHFNNAYCGFRAGQPPAYKPLILTNSFVLCHSLPRACHPFTCLIPPAARPDMSTYCAPEGKEFYTSPPTCYLGRLFSDSALISPSWTRVIDSPWGQSAWTCGGYGRRVINGSNSVDAPDFMYSKVGTVVRVYIALHRRI